MFRSLISNLTRHACRGAIPLLAVVCAGPVPVHAQDAETPIAPVKESETVELSADELTYDRDTRTVTARGRVLVSHDEYELSADEVRYNEQTGVVRAVGNVRIVDPDGNILLLDEIEVDDSLREGFVSNVHFIFSDGSRLAAQDGQRFAGRRTVLNFAVYSPCNVCADDPDDQPLWQIKAVRVTHDQQKRRLYYKNAFLEFFGVPVAYLPYLSHPDPSVDRATGFLVPEIKQRRELGVTLSLPYHIVFSPSSDATVTPILTTKEGLVLGGEYRRHLGFGKIKFDGSVTYTEQRNADNQKTGSHEFRGHIFSDGDFTHGRRWRSTYQFQWSSDDTYLRRYGFSQLDTLTSDYHAEGFYGRSYASIRSLWFKGLRVEDIQGLTGFPLPLAEFDYVGKPARNGSLIRANISALALNRLDGMDTRRLSARTSWEMPFQNAWGQLLKVSANLRGDLYHIADANRPDLPVFAGQNGFEGRFLPHLEASFRWPFAQVSAGHEQIIEPIVTAVVAPNGGNPSELSNEDSRTFELTDTNLFAANRFPGIDRWEGGSRINYGVKWSFFSGRLSSEALFGQSIRFNSQDAIFPDGSGLSGKVSDFVGRWDISIDGLVDLAHRFRLDKDTLRVRRNEIDAIFGPENARISVGYFQLNRNREIEGLEDTEEVRATARFRIKGNWTLFGNITQRLTDGSHPIAHGIGLLYTNECLEVSLAWQKSFTVDRDFMPGSSVTFRLRLMHLG